MAFEGQNSPEKRNRAARGGNRGDSAPCCRPAYRSNNRNQGKIANYLGFRVACTAGLR